MFNLFHEKWGIQMIWWFFVWGLTHRGADFPDLVFTPLPLPYLEKRGTLEQIYTIPLQNNDLPILNLEQNLEQVWNNVEQTIILWRYKTMRDFVGSIHLEVKSYLVEPLSLNGLTSHASPRAATHTRHARTNKELVSYAKRRHKKTPATLRLPGRVV